MLYVLRFMIMLNIYNQQSSEPTEPIKAEAPKKADFRKYKDPTDEFNSKELQYSIWYVQHKVLIYRLCIFSLVIINIFFLLLAGVQWTVYIAGIPAASQLEIEAARAPNYTVFDQQFSPQPLQVNQTNIFSGGINKYDIVSEVVNLNTRFVASFSYSYIIGNQKTEPQSATILPGQTTLIANLGLTTALNNATLQVEDLTWKRLSNHTIVDPKAFQTERLNFVVNNFVFSGAYGQGDLKVNRMTFNFANASAFSYRQPKFYVGLYNGGGLIGVMPLQYDSFASQETKAVDLRNFVNNAQVGSVRVFPRINVYDQNVYLPPAS
jgi:hypothetical protein